MPLYEYECQSCGEHVERIQRASDKPLTECPKCGGPLRRLLGVPALQFKGSGWYVTDYGNGNGRGEAPSGARKTGEGNSETSSNKPESSGKAEKSTTSVSE